MLKNSKSQIRFDFGLYHLCHEWKSLFSTKWLQNDIISGATVACIAVPLSLAIALASGVEPATGLISAIVGGFVCALFGGTPIAVSGPAAVMAVLIAAVQQQYGMGGLLVVGFGCGILQLLTGVFGLGQLVRFVPLPVVTGFTAGIGAIILIGQLPRALGLPPPDQSHVLDVITHIMDLIHETRLSALALTTSTVGLIFLLPRLLPKIPAPLVAVVLPSMAANFLGIQIEVIGKFPNSLPLPHLPSFPVSGLKDLVDSTLMVYSLASLETLLSSSAVDKLSKTQRHDPDQELIGQGFGNIASSLFGGIPVTGVIARSALNVQSGAKTRRAALFHSFFLLMTVYFLAPIIGKIPVAVLAGVLLSIALKMLHPQEFLQLWRTSHSEAAVYLITFFTIVSVDLIMGVQAGVAIALVITAIQFGRTRTDIQVFEAAGPSLVSLDGSLTFLSSSRIEGIRSQVDHLDPKRGLIMDMSEVKTVDASGATQFLELLQDLKNRKIRVALKGLTSDIKKSIFSFDTSKELSKYLRVNELELLRLTTQKGTETFERLDYGVERFRKELRPEYQALFQSLASNQNPHTLFIACSDSRINPNLITSTDPGELFIMRNVGNIIPNFGTDGIPAEGAAVEYAIGVLGVREIVVCGHSSCGAMNTLMSDTFFSASNRSEYPHIVNWLQTVRHIKDKLPPNSSANYAAEYNAVLQLENLKTYPQVRKKIGEGKLRLRAWYYNIGEAELEEWDEEKRKFVLVGTKTNNSIARSMGSGTQFQVP